jgi:hypothetical protein
LGANIVNLKADETYNATSSFDASKAYAVSIAGAVKFEYALIDCIGAFITAEYSMAMKKSDYFNAMEDVSTQIKGFASGFNARAGVSLFF